MRRLKFSIVIPSLNQGRFLERALESVRSQQYPEVECLVYDAGSTDNSVEIIRRHADWLTYWTSAPDGGQSEVIRQGWERSTGDVLAWLNADDFYFPGTFIEVARQFESNPQWQMLCGAMAIVDEAGNRLRTKKPPQLTPQHLLPWGSVPGQPSVFLLRDLAQKIGGPRTDLHYVMDWELWLRIALNCSQETLGRCEQVFSGATEWAETKTSTAAGRDAAEVRRVLEELFDSGRLPPDLVALRKKAFARSWWRQSESECAALKFPEARKSFKMALTTAPFNFSPLKILRHLRRLRGIPVGTVQAATGS